MSDVRSNDSLRREKGKEPTSTAKEGAAKSAPVSMTIVDVHRQQRASAKKWKTTVRKFAIATSIGLHAIALVIAGIYIVRKTVLHMNQDKVQSVVVTHVKSKPMRLRMPRATRRAAKPKTLKIRAPKGRTVTTSAKIPLGTASFTLPASDVSTRPVLAPSTDGIGKGLFSASRQANIVTTLPKFEVPKFETVSFVERMDMGTSLAQTEFNELNNLELASMNLGEAKQSFKEFLKTVRQRIERAQRFPPSVRNLEKGSSTTVRFTILRDGTVTNADVANSSGSRVLDNAAIAAVENGVPYPPFPEGQSGSSLRLELPIIFEAVN